MKKKAIAAVFILLLALAHDAGATPKKKNAQPGKAPAASYLVISPIFSQLVAFNLPAGFATVFENFNQTSYLREAVPAGETAERWTEMITVTGAKGLAANTGITPQEVAGSIAAGFEKPCPGSYSERSVKQSKTKEGQQYAAVFSCGTAPSTLGTTSETALVVVVKGEKDYYTVQWAERGAPSSRPVPLDAAKWEARLAKLVPIRLCPIKPGEGAPYPSCLQK